MNRKLVTLAFLASAMGAIVVTPAAARPPGANGKIVFNVDNSATGTEQVYTVDPDGTDLHLLSDQSEVGQWSSDGRQVALALNSGQGLLYNVDTGATTDLGLPFNRYPDLALYCGVWSPDGSRLACEGFGQTDGSLNGVYTVRSSDGSGLQRVTSDPNGDDCPSDYSPDGKRLVITRANDTTYEIDTVNVNGGGLKQVTPYGTNFDFCSGSWSPQGNQILFSAHIPNGTRSSIWVAHSDGTGLQQIPVPGCGGPRSDPTSIGCADPVWSPDGRKIAFSRHTLLPTEQFNLYTVNADGTGLFQVTTDPDLQVGGSDWGTHPLTP